MASDDPAASEVRYDNNPFLLDTARKARLEAPTAADSVNGRFRDMSRVTDVIPIPSLQLGLAGRHRWPDPRRHYRRHLRDNIHKRSATRGAAVPRRAVIAHSGGLRVTADWRPSYFHKNYLATPWI